jgi:hypothetical protein
MNEAFDPYQQWLGISPEEQPPNHYRLLGIQLFENDGQVIRSATERQVAQVGQFARQQPPHVAAKIVEELTTARDCLLSPEKKAGYDAQLWVALTARAEGWQAGGPPLEYHVKGAARYFWIQAKRLWIWQLRLPAAYQALGEHVYRDGRSRDRLASLFAEFERVSQRLAGLQARGAPPAENARQPRTVWARAWDFVGRITVKVRIAMAGRTRRGLLRRMGRSAYEVEGLSCGPEHLTGPIHLARSRLAQLRGEVAQLAVVPTGQLLSPRRLAWLVIAVLALPILMLFWFKLSLLRPLW